MKTRSFLTTTAVTVLLGSLLLTGCTTDQNTGPDPDTEGSDAAAAFLACLTAGKVDAKINDSGQILVKSAEQLGTSGETSSSEGTLGMEVDDAGNTWVIPADSSYFVDSPDIQDVYAACEKEHPDFTQASFDPADDPQFAEEMKKQEEQALVFAQCARDNGYSQIADPNFSEMNGILLPDDFTEDDFRSLVSACWDPESSFGFGSSEELTFEPWKILDELQSEPAS